MAPTVASTRGPTPPPASVALSLPLKIGCFRWISAPAARTQPSHRALRRCGGPWRHSSPRVRGARCHPFPTATTTRIVGENYEARQAVAATTTTTTASCLPFPTTTTTKIRTARPGAAAANDTDDGRHQTKPPWTRRRLRRDLLASQEGVRHDLASPRGWTTRRVRRRRPRDAIEQ